MSMQIDVSLNAEYLPIDVSLSTDDVFDVKFDANAGGRLPYFDGDYVVEPMVGEQILDTKNKSLKNDIVIDPIYYSEVSNPSGGETAYIGIE